MKHSEVNSKQSKIEEKFSKISVVILNVNGLNSPIKIPSSLDYIKIQKSGIYSL